MRKRLTLTLVVILLLACQLIPTPPPLEATSRVWTTPRSEIVQHGTPLFATPTQEVIRANLLTPSGIPYLKTASPVASLAPGDLPPFPYQPGKPFTTIEPVDWEAGRVAKIADVPLPIPMEQVTNWAVAAGLTSRQQSFLAQNGFVVLHTQEAQFNKIRERVSLRYGQPYYLTTDAAYHALHLTLDELFKALELEEIQPRMIAITHATLAQVNSYLPLVQGTNLEADTLLAAAYLGVALRLFDPQAILDPDLEQRVTAQVTQVRAGRGIEDSVLIPNFRDAFGAYQPVGHYARTPELEGYFQAMTWFERVHFDLQSEDSDFIPSRVPLVLTLALRHAQIGEKSAAEEWAKVQEVLDFLIRLGRDPGPAEYAWLMDEVFGRGITVVGLSDLTRWQTFQSLAPVLPTPPINSIFLRSLGRLGVESGWRFMGRRFNLDEIILQSLVYDRVSSADKMREIPSGLDVMAAFGSPVALRTLDEAGETEYADYLKQMAELQSAVQAQSEAQWQGTAFNSWMYAFSSQLAPKDEKFPFTMRSLAWSYKNLNSALGGWVDNRLDSIPYATAPEISLDGRAPTSGPAPGYVEPEPLVFYRLAYLAMATAEGLSQRGLEGIFSTDSSRLGSLLLAVLDLGDRLQRFGDIAAKELAGLSLEESDLRLIQAPLGPAEERAWLSLQASARGVGRPLDLPPTEGVVSWEGSHARILQVGLGAVDRIYVIVPLNGELQIAQGGVFSYYEFSQPTSWRLSDEEWRQLLRLSPPDRPVWVENFSLPDGNPVDALAFRIGDVYRITLAGALLNLHESPSRIAQVVRKLQPGEYALIVDGPIQTQSSTWWKLRLDFTTEQPVEGWAVENQEWYERAWGQ